MDGDQQQEMTRLYEGHADAVMRYAQRRSDRETAEEVVAQVFLVAWRHRSTLPDEALPWLYGVARRVLSEQRRGAMRRRRLHERLRGEAIEVPPALELRDGRLGEALMRLSDGDREALLLRYWEELEPEQVAAALGCSRATLAVRLHRARARLRRDLDSAAGRKVENEEHGNSCVGRTETV
ncbi:MAG TPA: sigma-70 family RNA polymerase sigma factor [Solirubrobacteraceae bacterium]